MANEPDARVKREKWAIVERLGSHHDWSAHRMRQLLNEPQQRFELRSTLDFLGPEVDLDLSSIEEVTYKLNTLEPELERYCCKPACIQGLLV